MVMEKKSTLPGVFTKRQRYETARSEMEIAYGPHRSYHRDLLDFIAPMRGRFQVTDANRVTRNNRRILKQRAVENLGILKAGMMAGITNPAVDWVRLTLENKALAEFGPVKEWLDFVTNDMNDVFQKSNFYKVTPTVYGDMASIAIAAVLVEEDPETVVRYYSLPPGSYKTFNNARGQVDQFTRDFRMTVTELVHKFGFLPGQRFDADNIDWSKFSKKIRDFWKEGKHNTWVDVTHIILPNEDWDSTKLDAKFKRYSSAYYERGIVGDSAGRKNPIQDPNLFLRESGHDIFPIFVPRWETTGEDSWGTNCPNMKSLGENKALQTVERRSAQADELGINPPMVYPAALKKKSNKTLPGSKIYTDSNNGDMVIREAFKVNFDKVSIDKRMDRYEKALDAAFHRDAFRAISDLESRQRTAFEIDSLLQESRLLLGNTIVNVNDDFLIPNVDFTFNAMENQGRIPEAPEEIQGIDLKVELIGVLAQSQKSISTNSLRAFYNDVGQIANLTAQPSPVWDKVRVDQLVDELADAGRVNPSVIVSDDEVDAIREQRAIQQEAIARQEAAASMAGTAKDLSETQTGGDTALTAISDALGGEV